MRASKIILVTVDALRADRVGSYGYTKATTPNLDGYAREWRVFKNAFTPCSYTVPAHTAMLTGRYPGNNTVFFSQGKGGGLDKDREITFPEVLSDKGYETAAFMGSRVLRRVWGLDAGFAVYDDNTTTAEANRPDQLIRTGEDTNKVLFEWLSNSVDKDFFAWVHYFDVHGPYTSPEPFASFFRPEDYGPEPLFLDMVAEGQPGGIPAYQLLNVKKDEAGNIAGYERDARAYFAQYDAGVRHADHILGQMLGELKRLGIYEDTVVIITADHGEAMGENGVYFFHGLTVTPDQARVPLMIKLPGNARKGEIADAVSTVDIMPTVLDLAGFDWSTLGLDGESLLNGENGGRLIFCENEWQRAVINNELFLVMEKDVIRDGFTFYFDSKDLCMGTKVFDSKTGDELCGQREGANSSLPDLIGRLFRHVDQREVTIRNRDAVVMEKEALIKDLTREKDALTKRNDALTKRNDALVREKDALVKEKEAVIRERDKTIREREAALDSLEISKAELEKAVQDGRKELEDIRSELEQLHAAYQERVAKLNKQINYMVKSKSWRLTYPIRRVSAFLKGIKPEN